MSTKPRELPAIASPSEERSFAEDVIFGLASAPKTLPCKYFYDARGGGGGPGVTTPNTYLPAP